MVVGQPPSVNPMSTARGTDTVAGAVGQLLVDVTRIVKRPSRCVGAECGVFWWCAEKPMVAGGDTFVDLAAPPRRLMDQPRLGRYQQ